MASKPDKAEPKAETRDLDAGEIAQAEQDRVTAALEAGEKAAADRAAAK